MNTQPALRSAPAAFRLHVIRRYGFSSRNKMSPKVMTKAPPNKMFSQVAAKAPPEVSIESPSKVAAGCAGKRSVDTPFRLAIVGSGPAGFYAASKVFNRIPVAQVDMYEALPVPFGLVRYGVAPDHPEVKNCQVKFEIVASSPNFRFLGNVAVGSTSEPSCPDQCRVQLQQLLLNYDSVLLAYGASQDKKLDIPGESTLKGIHSARQFVGWYNGLPECAGLQPCLDGQEAVIIGNGNVALDVARMLLEDVDVLRKTDITEHALAYLSQSKIKRVHVVGRRGLVQASFGSKEMRELIRLPNVAFHPVNRSQFPEDLKRLPRHLHGAARNILKGSTKKPGEAPLEWSLDSCLSPRHFYPHSADITRVASTEFDVMRLEFPLQPKSQVKPTTETAILPSDVVFRAIGYQSTPLDGFAQAGISFDGSRGIINNDGFGRITRSDDNTANQRVPGLYCTGWVKSGPIGKIGDTMYDAYDTADALTKDWLVGDAFLQNGTEAAGWDGIRADPSTINPDKAIDWNQWLQIDEAERKRGILEGKPRTKFISATEMLSVIG